MAATETSIRATISPSLQWTLFGLLSDKESCKPSPEKTDEYNRAYLSNLATELLSHVSYGQQDEAEHMIKDYPDVLLFRPSRPVKDIAGNLYAGTAFQYALWAMDTHMYNMMLACLPPNKQGETIRKDLLEQAKAQTEHFDFTPLIEAFQTYVDNYDQQRWRQTTECWCKVVGGAQKTLPAHVRQEYCNPALYPIPNFTEKVFTRSLRVYIAHSATWQTWDEGLLGLGSDFAITRSRFGLIAPGATATNFSVTATASVDLNMVIALYKARTSDLHSLMQQLQLPIQKPDDTEGVPRQSIF